MKKVLLNVMMLLLLCIIASTQVSAQLGTTSNSLSLTGFVGEPIKSVAYGENQVIFLYRQGNKSVFHLATVGGLTVQQATLHSEIVYDFDVIDTVIAFCGTLTTGGAGFVGCCSVNSLFSGGSIQEEYLNEDIPITNIKLFKVATQYCAAMVLNNKAIIDCRNLSLVPTIGGSIVTMKYVALEGDIHDITVTNNFVCAVGTGNSNDDANHIFVYRYNKYSALTTIETHKVPTSGPIIYYGSEFNGSYYTSFTYKSILTALGETTDLIMTGTHILVNGKTYEEYHTIDMSAPGIVKVEDVLHSQNGRPELYDLEYDRYHNKVLVLTYSLDYDRDIFYEIDPLTPSGSILAMIPYYGPMPTSSTASHKHFLKDITVYRPDYYMVFGKQTNSAGYILDKNYGVFIDNSCYQIVELQTQQQTVDMSYYGGGTFEPLSCIGTSAAAILSAINPQVECQ